MLPFVFNLFMAHKMYDVSTGRFHGTVYPCPETQSERREMAMGVVTRIEDLRTVRYDHVDELLLLLVLIMNDDNPITI